MSETADPTILEFGNGFVEWGRRKEISESYAIELILLRTEMQIRQRGIRMESWYL